MNVVDCGGGLTPRTRMLDQSGFIITIFVRGHVVLRLIPLASKLCFCVGISNSAVVCGRDLWQHRQRLPPFSQQGFYDGVLSFGNHRLHNAIVYIQIIVY